MRDRHGRPRGLRSFQTAIAVAALLGAATASGVVATAPALAAPAKGAPTIVNASTSNSAPLPAPGMVVVESIQLTKGNWTLMAKATAANGGPGDFFRCELFDATHAAVLDGATAFLNSGVQRDVITDLAVFRAKGSVTISQECGHDGTAGNSGSIDAGASVVAFVTKPARVRVARSTAQTTLGDTGDVPVVHVRLPAGSWVIATKFSPVVLSSPLVQVTCSDNSEGGALRELGTQAGLHAVSTVFKVGVIENLTKPTTITLNCGATAGSSYIDPGAVLWAWKAGDLRGSSNPSCPVTYNASLKDALVLHQSNDCSIPPGSFTTELIGADLRPGTWVAFAGIDGLASQGANVARCELYDNNDSRQLDAGAASLSTITGVAITGITQLAVVTTTRTIAVDGNCGEDGAGPAAAIVDSEWAFIKP